MIEAEWGASIAPLPRVEDRYARGTALAHLEDATVSLRGWNFPHIPHHDPQDIVSLPDGGVEGRTNWAQYVEIWRFHPDGLFTQRWRMREDGTAFKGSIHFVAAIYTLSEVFELAKRLYRGDATVEAIEIGITLENVLGRPGGGDSFVDLPYELRASRNRFEHRAQIPRVDLEADVTRPAADAGEAFFGQLGFRDISRSFIEGKVKAFLEGRI